MNATTTTTYYNEQQRDLMRAIAVRAVMNASGDNCFCPVKKPTKFIVTLKPVVKMPNTDHYLNLQPKFSVCTCNTQTSTNKTTAMKLTAEQIQVRNNTEALKGKTLLNAFRILTNSKFVSIDPTYNYGDNGVLSPSCEKLRLSGGGEYGEENNRENIYLQAGEPAASTKACPCNKLIRPTQEKVVQERVTLGNCRRKPKRVDCEEKQIYHILQRNCCGENAFKEPPKCRIVCPAPEYVQKEVEQRRRKKKQTSWNQFTSKQTPKGTPKSSPKSTPKPSPKPSRERVYMRRELERGCEVDEVAPPTPLIPPAPAKVQPMRAEKSVGTSDEPPGASTLLSWDPLKYFGLTCQGTKKNEEEKCEEKPTPCALSFLPYPSIRKPEPCAAASQLPPPPPPPRKPEPCEKVVVCNCPSCMAAAVSPPVQQEISRPPPPQPKPPEISSEVIAQQCNRIHKLEQQVYELRCELGKMRTEIIPPDDMLRCTALTSKLRELTALLADLKNRHAEAITEVIMAQKQAAANKPHQAEPCAAASQPHPPPSSPLSPSPPHPAPPPAVRPEMRAQNIQTCFADSYRDQLSQTNASFGWRPFVDEATQSSPPSTARATPKNTSSVPASSRTSSAASEKALPCGHGTGELPLKKSPSFCPHCQGSEYPRCAYVERNLCGQIMAVVKHHSPREVLLSVLLQPNNLYHVNISLTSTGAPLGCIYATEQAINEAVEAGIFNRFLTFFIVDARISVQQKDKILAHTFEFFKN